MNPFRESVMSDPWDTPRGDVPTIHEHVFRECLGGLKSVRTAYRSTALLIHGEAGSGKTHLLGRLRAQLAPTLPTATDRSEALFVWVRLQTSPRMIWRTVRRTLVNDWFRPLQDGRSQFDRILFHRLAELRVAEGDLEPWHEYMLQEDPAGLSELVGQISDRLQLDRNTHVALEHLVFCRHRRDLQAWLCGDSLPESVLSRLELEESDEGDEEREDQARRAILMLCRLAGAALPIVIALDQVEALETGPEDRAALFAFGQLVSTLHDSTANVLLISAVQSAFAERLRQEARAADHDRMTSAGKLSLAPLSRDEARLVIRQRLESGGEAGRAEASGNPFWPLSEGDLVPLFRTGAVTPRQLLNRCAERYENPLVAKSGAPFVQAAPVVQIVSPEKKSLAASLEELWASAVEEKLRVSHAEHSEQILRHALPMVAVLQQPDLQVQQDELLRDVCLIFSGASGRLGVSVCTQSNMQSLASRLRRLRTQASSGRLRHLVVIRDCRVPITATAQKARRYLEELEADGRTSVLQATPEVLAALDALRALLSDARSGDLSCFGETVTPGMFEEWFRGRLAGPLQDFVRQVLESGEAGAGGQVNGGAATTALFESLQQLLVGEPVVSVVSAAERLRISERELLELAVRSPATIGVLGGEQPMLFRVVAVSEGEISGAG